MKNEILKLKNKYSDALKHYEKLLEEYSDSYEVIYGFNSIKIVLRDLNNILNSNNIIEEIKYLINNKYSDLLEYSKFMIYRYKFIFKNEIDQLNGWIKKDKIIKEIYNDLSSLLEM